MKKLNRKGFTLIELLAVIVIMAIILVVTVPTIINSISDARVSSIWNLAVSSANSYDTMAANDLLATDKVLDDIGITVTDDEWACISTELAELLDLSSGDVVIGDNEPSGDNPTVTQTTCSAIKLKANGAAEVLLVAEEDGRFYVSGNVTYGLSSADKGDSKK